MLTALRRHFPLLRRERQSYNSGTLIALVRSVLIFVLCFSSLYILCSQPVRSYSLIWLPGLRSASSTACRKWQKSKSNCSSPPTYSSLYGFLEGNWTLRYDILQGYYNYFCKVDRALGAASAKVELMRQLKLGMETTMPSALLEVD